MVLLPTSGEEQRGEALAAGDRRRILRSPGVEELHKLLARRLLVPGTVAADDLQELIGRAGPVSLPVQDDGKVEAGLMVVRTGLDAPAEIGGRAEFLRLGGKVERGAGADDCRVLVLLGG